jgi:hypothetical protein
MGNNFMPGHFSAVDFLETFDLRGLEAPYFTEDLFYGAGLFCRRKRF